jgi:hypothetical protein
MAAEPSPAQPIPIPSTKGCGRAPHRRRPGHAPDAGLAGRRRRAQVRHICGETLATELKVGDTPAGWQTLPVDIDGEQATLALMTATA